MAREFSKSFYRSKAWKEAREYIYIRDKGLCQECLKQGIIIPGKEVHHIEHLTPENMNDPNITLGESNLILLCRDCHSKKHKNNKCLEEGLMFNSNGDLIVTSDESM